MLAAGPAGLDEHLGIWTLSTLTGEIRKLADDGFSAVFSPDGRQVAFIGGRNEELWLMGPKGESARRLASTTPGDGFISISFSPDGSRLAALKVSGADLRVSTIETYDVSGGVRTEILAQPRISALAWKADGRLIYAQQAAAPQQEAYGLWELTLDSGETRLGAASRRLATWMSQSVGSLSVSRDGQRVLMTRGRTRSNVYVGRLNASSSELSNVAQLTADDRVNWPSAWTPDGRAVLFHSDRNGDFDLFKQAFSDREAQPLLLGPDEARTARMSPDGRWILYLTLAPTDARSRTARVRLMRMPAGGGAPEQILETAGNWGRGDSIVTVDGDYFWSYPEFRCSAAARPAPCVIGEAAGTDQTVFTAIDPERGRQGEVARVKASAEFLPWDLSPDGTRLAYALTSFYALPNSPVQVLTLADRTTRVLPSNTWRDPAGIAWSASGNELFLTDMSVRGSRLVSMELGGRVHVLRDLAGKGLYLADPRPSPDGRQLAFGQATLGSNAWVLESPR